MALRYYVNSLQGTDVRLVGDYVIQSQSSLRGTQKEEEKEIVFSRYHEKRNLRAMDTNQLLKFILRFE